MRVPCSEESGAPGVEPRVTLMTPDVPADAGRARGDGPEPGYW